MAQRCSPLCVSRHHDGALVAQRALQDALLETGQPVQVGHQPVGFAGVLVVKVGALQRSSIQLPQKHMRSRRGHQLFTEDCPATHAHTEHTAGRPRLQGRLIEAGSALEIHCEVSESEADADLHFQVEHPQLLAEQQAVGRGGQQAPPDAAAGAHDELRQLGTLDGGGQRVQLLQSQALQRWHLRQRWEGQ